MTPLEEALSEFLTAAEAAAFAIGEPCPTCKGLGSVPGTRKILHTYAGPFGADWDLADALSFIRDADAVQWEPASLTGHELAAVKNGRLVRFDVKAPR